MREIIRVPVINFAQVTYRAFKIVSHNSETHIKHAKYI